MRLQIQKCFRFKNSYYRSRDHVRVLSMQATAVNASSQSPGSVGQRNELFNTELKRQLEATGRIEKIAVKVYTPLETTTLFMNKYMSTPYDCAKHISDHIADKAAIAILDSDRIWDMHRPLPSECELKYVFFDDDNPDLANKVFWESCSIILGGVISNAFKDSVSVTLHSYPPPNIKSGSFAYDVKLSLENWKPTEDELRILSAEGVIFSRNQHKFERLTARKDLALQIMKGNPFKEEQVEHMSSENEGGMVTLYRLGNHIDVCEGPLMNCTSLVNRFSVTAVHQISTDYGQLYRFQGVAIPCPLMINHYAFGILQKRAMNLNPGPYPQRKCMASK